MAVMTTFDRVVGVLSDGDWHTDAELHTVTRVPAIWMKELVLSGYSVEERGQGERHRYRLRLDKRTR